MMKLFVSLCVVAIVLQACLAGVPMPGPGSLPIPLAESVVNEVLSSAPATPAAPSAKSVVDDVLSSIPITLTPPTVPTPVAPTVTVPAERDAAELAIQTMPCDNVDDVQHIISNKVTQIIDEGGILSDWFPDDIATNLNNTVYNAHSKLVEHVKLIVNITSEFDDELDRAVEIAGSRIGLETERIDGDEKMTALLRAVPDVFKDSAIISKVCPIVKKAAISAHLLQEGLFTCEKQLKYAIIPNVDQITADLESLSKKIISIDKDTDDDSSLLPLVDEIKALHATVEIALSADKNIVMNAGIALTKCVVSLINNAKKETDAEYDEFKSLIPNDAIPEAYKSMQKLSPVPEPTAVPLSPAVTVA